MKVWLVTVIALFGIVEFYQWLSQLEWLQIALLPTPILLTAGIGLAIASNAKKHLPWQTWPQPNSSVQSASQPIVRSTLDSAKSEQ